MHRNITEVSKFHIRIIPLWFLLSIFLGQIITIPHFLLNHIKNIFMPYMIYMDHYDIFCNTMFFIIFWVLGSKRIQRGCSRNNFSNSR